MGSATDLVYFDPADLSFEAESEQIAVGRRRRFNGVPVPLDIKNQARVHLWYEDKFGIKPGLSRPEMANLRPFGLEDLFSLTIRPNKALISEAVYRSKAEKWQSRWPELQIIPWEDSRRKYTSSYTFVTPCISLEKARLFVLQQVGFFA